MARCIAIVARGGVVQEVASDTPDVLIKRLDVDAIEGGENPRTTGSRRIPSSAIRTCVNTTPAEGMKMPPAEEKRCPQGQGVHEEVKALACSSRLSGEGSRCHVCTMLYDRDLKPWAKVTSRGEVTMREREPPLVCLWRPGTRDIFSGYGLRMAPAHLVGVMMVDRPRPVDPAWLEVVRQTFGGYELVPMTRSGERGMICQMRIVEDSPTSPSSQLPWASRAGVFYGPARTCIVLDKHSERR